MFYRRKNKWFALLSTNLFGVFNNNLLKGLICFICISWVAKGKESEVLAYSTALLVIPYILFSPLGGKLAKTKFKTRVIVLAKKVEIVIMFIAFVGFLFESLPIVLFALLLIGLQSSLLSPSKYGLIRDIGGNENISYGTGNMDMVSFLAVLVATFAAGFISDMKNYQVLTIALFFIIISIAGIISSIKIKAIELPPEKSDRSTNPIIFLKDSFVWAKSVRGLNYIILGSGFFWFIASMVQMNLILYCPKVYAMTHTETSFVIAVITIGVALGCWASGIISRGKIQLGLLPISGICLSILITAISFISMQSWLFTLLLFIFAFFCGIFKIILNTWLQRNVIGREQGNMLAYGNMVDFIFILFSAGLFRLVDMIFDNYVVFINVAIFSWFITMLTLIKIPDTYSMFRNLIFKANSKR
jgi:MFS family permease